MKKTPAFLKNLAIAITVVERAKDDLETALKFLREEMGTQVAQRLYDKADRKKK